MASTASKDIPAMVVTDPKPKKKRKPKKKGGNPVVNTESLPSTPTENQTPSLSPTRADGPDSEDSDLDDSEPKPTEPSTEGTSVDEDVAQVVTNGVKRDTNNTKTSESPSDTTIRFDALVKDRDALRAEVTHLRQSLESLQSKHEHELEAVQVQLQDTQAEKEQAEEQYQNLFGKVNTIRSQLGERLKADAEELAQARMRIEDLEEQKSGLQEQYTAKSADVEDLESQVQTQSKELSSLRNRANLSQQNWVREKEEMIEQETYMREEFENAKQAMHDWEVLAMEERSIRRDLADKVGDLEEQLSSLKESYERAASERDTQSNTVDGLQNALQEIQIARKKELRELVETSQTEMEGLRKQLTEAQTAASAASSELDATKKELERAAPFEKEVKEKNLLIGKLRHEAVILNDHLTKALRFLKKGKPEDNIDRQIVTNHLLHFLSFDRSDPKKFQILQLIASLLNWTDEQREQAGLSRPGGGASSSAGSGSLRLPSSPLVHRTPSSPALTSGEYFQGMDSATSPGSATTKESLAELWQHFLEQEANSGGDGVGGVRKLSGVIMPASKSGTNPGSVTVVPPQP